LIDVRSVRGGGVATARGAASVAPPAAAAAASPPSSGAGPRLTVLGRLPGVPGQVRVAADGPCLDRLRRRARLAHPGVQGGRLDVGVGRHAGLGHPSPPAAADGHGRLVARPTVAFELHVELRLLQRARDLNGDDTFLGLVGDLARRRVVWHQRGRRLGIRPADPAAEGNERAGGA